MNLQTLKKTFLEDTPKVKSDEFDIWIELFNKRINASLLDSMNGRVTENSKLVIEILSWE